MTRSDWAIRKVAEGCWAGLWGVYQKGANGPCALYETWAEACVQLQEFLVGEVEK